MKKSYEYSINLFSDEILEKIFSFLNAKTLRKAMSVSEKWKRMLSSILLAYYQSQAPHALKNGQLLKYALEELNKYSYFGFIAQDMIFKNYMRNIFEEEVSESLLDYTNRVSHTFSTGQQNDLDFLKLRTDYVKHQNQGHATRIAYLFNFERLCRFSQNNNKETLLSEEALEMAHMLWAARRVESWLTLLVLFQKKSVKPANVNDLTWKWHILMHSVWNQMLLGHGLIAFNFSIRFSDLLELKQIRPTSQVKILEFLFSRLTSKDIQNYLNHFSYKPLLRFIAQENPQLLALLSNGSKYSDEALIILLKIIYEKKLLHKLSKFPILAQRLTHPLFISRLLNYKDFNVVNFINQMLVDERLVCHLKNDQLLMLMADLTDAKIFKPFKLLDKFNRLNAQFILKLISKKTDNKKAEFVSFICDSEEVRACLALENKKFALDIAHIILQNKSHILSRLFIDSKITQQWTSDELACLLKLAYGENQSQLEKLLIEKQEENKKENKVQSNRFSFLSIFSIFSAKESNPCPSQIVASSSNKDSVSSIADEKEFSMMSLPDGMLHYIFSELIDPATMRRLMCVNKLWEKICSFFLLEHYTNEWSPALYEGHLLDCALDWVKENPHALSNDNNVIFKKYMEKVFEEDINESLLDYIEISTKKFLNDTSKETDWNDSPINLYVARQNKGYAIKVNYFFNLERLQRCFEISNRVKISEDGFESLVPAEQREIAYILWTAQRIESWLTLLVLFQKKQAVPNNRNSEEWTWQILQNYSWTTMLLGHGLVALSFSKSFHDILEKIITFSFAPVYPFLNEKVVNSLLNRINSKHLYLYLREHSQYAVLNAIEQQQPQILKLLCSGDVWGDQALIFLLKKNSKILGVFSKVPALVNHLTHPFFLNRIFSYYHLKKKYYLKNFIKQFITYETFVHCLNEEQLLILINFEWYDSSNLNDLFKILANKKRLTGSFLLKFANLPEKYPGKLATIIGASEEARACLAQAELNFSFSIAQKILEYDYLSLSPLFIDSRITDQWSLKELDFLIKADVNFISKNGNQLRKLFQEKKNAPSSYFAGA